MKWIAWFSTLLLSACICTNTEVLESPQVITASPQHKPFRGPSDSVDVTTTTVKLY